MKRTHEGRTGGAAAASSTTAVLAAASTAAAVLPVCSSRPATRAALAALPLSHVCLARIHEGNQVA